MANLGNFTGEGVETLGDYSPIPPGKYTATIVESELLNNKQGTGTYIKLKFQIMGGEYDNRFVWNNITYQHQNNQAQEIGHKELNTLRMACKLEAIQDTIELHGIAHVIEVKIEESNGYSPQNVVKNYYDLDGASGVAQAPAPTQDVQSAPTPQAQAPTPDWAS